MNDAKKNEKAKFISYMIWIIFSGIIPLHFSLNFFSNNVMEISAWELKYLKKNNQIIKLNRRTWDLSNKTNFVCLFVRFSSFGKHMRFYIDCSLPKCIRFFFNNEILEIKFEYIRITKSIHFLTFLSCLYKKRSVKRQ